MNHVHALVPLKFLHQAKTRLAGLLDEEERQHLVIAMVRDVLAVLSTHKQINTVSLISDDEQALELAAEFGAQLISEQALGVSGLNPVIEAAVNQLALLPKANVLVLHGDLPCLHSNDITAVLDALRIETKLVVGADEAGTGSNLLAFNSGDIPSFQFGEGSCVKHRTQTASIQLNRPGIALDVDQPEDLQTLLHAPSVGAHTRLFLEQSDIATRLQLPLPAHWLGLKDAVLQGHLLSHEQALSLATVTDTSTLAAVAGTLRDRSHRNLVTYSRKVFIPLTQLCRDVCHYCTFAQTPKRIEQPYMPVEEVLELCRQGTLMGCQEALFTLGEKPELRYSAARKALAEMGYKSTLDYLQDVASRVLKETGLLPHINAGCMTADEIAQLRPVSASMGIMLESASARLCEKGMPHYGSPDKDPAVRLDTMRLAGEASVPFTSGILIGIGETRTERIESLLALRELHLQYGHLQEVIVQNFRAKAGTLMSSAPEPDLDELLWTIAVARLIFGPQMNIQAPPNLSPGVLPQLIAAGINDWGGVSPLTPDHVNPEAPWPHLEALAKETAAAGKFLDQRLTIYPQFALDKRWLDPALHSPVAALSDAMGYARRDNWVPGEQHPVPAIEAHLLVAASANTANDAAVSDAVKDIVERCRIGGELSLNDVTRLFESRGEDFRYVAQMANQLRTETIGDTVTYAVNRNINYTNVCYFKCQFCAFSKGKHSENLRGKPYDISGEEIARRCTEAWDRGATEVCMQGGIHPDYTGQTYLDILRTVRGVTPNMHIHAFSPLEVWQGAATLGISVERFLLQLKAAGLNTLPGTAAEILHDEVRATLCSDKLNTGEWLEVMETAHKVGLRTTATIMYGHIEQSHHWAHHLLEIRALQQRTGGFTEFVPLPFVHMEAPMFLKGNARPGPSFREAVLMHAVARLVFHGLIDNIQTSWVKMGEAGVAACLAAGANDLGGTLMNESITRAAGSGHGQEWSPQQMETVITGLGRKPRMRTTLYGDPPAAQSLRAFNAQAISESQNQSAAKRQRSKLIPTVELVSMEVPVSLLGHKNASSQVYLMAACD